MRWATALLGLWLLLRRSKLLRDEQRSTAAVIASLEARLASIQQQQLIIMHAVCPAAARTQPGAADDVLGEGMLVAYQPPGPVALQHEDAAAAGPRAGRHRAVPAVASAGAASSTRRKQLQPSGDQQVTPDASRQRVEQPAATPSTPAARPQQEMQREHRVAGQAHAAAPAHHPIALFQAQAPLPLVSQPPSTAQVAAHASTGADRETGGDMEVDEGDNRTAQLHVSGTRGGKRKRGTAAHATSDVQDEEEQGGSAVAEAAGKVGVHAGGKRSGRGVKQRKQ